MRSPAEVVSVDDMGSGIASIRPQSLVNLMKVSTLMLWLTAGHISREQGAAQQACLAAHCCS
jgi:hypothetical protein